MEIQELSIEVTRRCNLKCTHCMRGDAQNMVMSEEIIRNIFLHIDKIDSLIIAGGEPSLPSAVKAINMIYQQIVWRNVEIGNAFAVTNGVRKSKPFLEAMDKLIGLCYDNEISGIGISNDIYHIEQRGNERYCYDYEDILYCDENIHNITEEMLSIHTTTESNNWYNRGRAAENGIGNGHEEYLDCIKLNDLENPERICGSMYISCDGTITGDINMPYADMKKYSRGNIMNWEDALEQMRKSTIDNYEYCCNNCQADYVKSAKTCCEWRDCQTAIEQIEQIEKNKKRKRRSA